MTTEQIKLFCDYLVDQNRYHTFWDCLQKVPIDTMFVKKETYLPRVSAVLVMSYGFFQDRNINKVKTGEWRRLRDGWIEYASEAGMLGDEFSGIDPKNIISAINAVFNFKQYRGDISCSEKYTNEIAKEAASIQSNRTQMFDVTCDEEIKRLQEIINDDSVRTPNQVYTAEKLGIQIKLHVVAILTSLKYAGKKNTFGREATELNNALINGNESRIETCLDTVINTCNSIRKTIDDAKEAAKSIFEKERQEYEVSFAQWQEEKEKASERLAYLSKQKEEQSSIPPVQISEMPSQGKSVPASSPSEDKEEIIMLNDNFKSNRIVLMPNNMSCIYDKGIKYRLTINSTISRILIANNFRYYTLLTKGGYTCIRFSSIFGRNSIVSTSSTCSINSKALVEYLYEQFSITSRSMLMEVEEIEKTEKYVTYKIISASSVTFC